MVRTLKKLRIDINEDVHDILTSKQGDALTRFLDIQITDGAFKVDLTERIVRFYALKPDGKKIFNEAIITDAQNGRCQVELTDQTLACAGVVRAELSIFSKDAKEILSTKVFRIMVSERIRDDDALVSSNEYGALVILMQDLHELQEEITAWHARLDAEFERITNENITAWENMRQEQNDEFGTFMDESENRIEVWMSDVMNDINKLQVFDFDNLAALESVYQVTEFTDNVMTATIINKYSELKIAEAVATLNIDGSMQTVITVYDKNGINIFKRATMNTVFENGKIITDCEGYNDYTMTADLSTGIDGGLF